MASIVRRMLLVSHCFSPISWNAIFGTEFTMHGDDGMAKADAQTGNCEKREKYIEKNMKK